MIEFLTAWAESTWMMMVDSAFLFMVGLVLAGMIWLVMNEKNLARWLQGDGLRSVFIAALVGIPLPLCSCSVLPVAQQLRRAGASKGSVVSFLVSTPESGADSILLTWSLTDPILTVARPVVAFVAALLAGITEILFPSNSQPTPLPIVDPTAKADCDDCGCETKSPIPAKRNIFARIWLGVHYAFTDLLKDLSPYLLIGFLLAGLIGAFLDTGLIDLPESVKSGWIGYLGAVVIGLPMYICASSSTPLAAVLLVAGFSPGAILVFLLVGPATNLASLVVVNRIIGTASTIRYLLVVVGTALAGGMLVDKIYVLIGLSPDYQSGAAMEHLNWFYVFCAIFLSIFILYYGLKAGWRQVRAVFS